MNPPVTEALQPFIGQWQTNPRLGISSNHGSQSDLWVDFFDAMDSQ